MTVEMFISWLLVGAIAGWIGSVIAGTDRQQGMVGNIVVGIIGAFLGGLILNLFGVQATTPSNGFSLASLLTAILGAAVLLYIVRAVQRSRV